MAEASRIAPAQRNKSATLLAGQVAGRQWGVIGTRQLEGCRVTRSMATRWRRQGRLHLIHPGVHALGHPSVPIEGRLVAALLYVGSTAVLSHRTAAWWWGLIEDEPTAIDVSCLRRVHRTSGIQVHQRRAFESTRHRRFPITTLPQTFLDLAAKEPLAILRHALAKADYLNLLDAEGVSAIAGQGKPGSTRLREALRRHLPRLAYTRSRFERAFLALCERAGIPLPEVNAQLHGWTADALWRAQCVVVELDGYDNHRSRAQIERDRRKDLALRAAGYLVLRYTWPQVIDEPELVIADLLAALADAPRRADAASFPARSAGRESR